MKNFYFLVCLSAMFLLGCSADGYMSGDAPSDGNPFKPGNSGSPLNYSNIPGNSFGASGIGFCNFPDYACELLGEEFLLDEFLNTPKHGCCVVVASQYNCSHAQGSFNLASCQNTGSCLYADGRCEGNVLPSYCNGTYTNGGGCDTGIYKYCVSSASCHLIESMEDKMDCLYLGASGFTAYYATSGYCSSRGYRIYED
jgi:hypothetical protein